jgi:hypothetical protein
MLIHGSGNMPKKSVKIQEMMGEYGAFKELS